METEKFFTEMGDDFERAFKGYPPRISLDGWWWKRYIPYFRRIREVSQMIVENEWRYNRDNVEQMMDEAEKREKDRLIRSIRDY